MSDHPCVDDDGDGQFLKTPSGRWVLFESDSKTQSGLFVIFCPFCGEKLE